MPELPDVEGFRRYFARYAAGRRVEKVEVLDRSLLRNTTTQGIAGASKSKRLGRPGRHGKGLLAPAGRTTVLFHFGMTGELRRTSRPEPRHAHDRIVFALEGGELRCRNIRRFGGVWLGRSPEDSARIMKRPGPDALELDRESFLALLEGRRGAVKPALMDQKLLAGLGNELSDEILWQARLHPHRRGWLTAVRADRAPACPRCGSRLERGRVGGRTAYWCPRCQPLPGERRQRRRSTP